MILPCASRQRPAPSARPATPPVPQQDFGERPNQSQNAALTERALSPGPKGHFPVLISIRRRANRSVIDGGGARRRCT